MGLRSYMDKPVSSVLTDPVRRELEMLVRVVERQSREFRASVLLVSDDGRHLVDAAAPSLPDAYREAVDGLEIGPTAGSCGTAAFRRSRVVVADIATDPLWEPYRDLAARFELGACWSQPIVVDDDRVVGTFAMYYAEPNAPRRKDIDVIEAAAERAARLLGGVSRKQSGKP